MHTFVISAEDRRDILAMLERFRPLLHTEVAQIELLRRKIDEAVIVPASKLSPSIVALGSTVRVVDLGPRQEKTYTLVFPDDADVYRRTISLLSPLGTAMLGCAEGTIIELRLPVSTIPFAIKEVVRADVRRAESAGARSGAW